MENKRLHFTDFKTTYLGISVYLDLKTNIVFLSDISGTGKTFIWRLLDDEKVLDSRIVTYNYKNVNTDLLCEISKLNEKFIVIDNADIVLTDDLRDFIARDINNQYMIIGRDPRRLFLQRNNFYRLVHNNNVISLEQKYRRK